MFPPQIQLIFDAQQSLQAAQANDPRFGQLVEALEKRTGLTKEEVVKNIVQLANGNLNV